MFYKLYSVSQNGFPSGALGVCIDQATVSKVPAVTYERSTPLGYLHRPQAAIAIIFCRPQTRQASPLYSQIEEAPG
jgi:hypothetical protein